MADETDIQAVSGLGGEGAADVELRPCAFCGHSIHPAGHRCTHCDGHVGLAWGTVHKELFLFLFLSVMVIVGCLASWTGRTPALSAAQMEKAQAAAQAAADQETIRIRVEVEKEN